MNERREPTLVSRRSQSFTIGLFLLLAAGLVAGLVQVPLVGLGPGPTYDTLGEAYHCKGDTANAVKFYKAVTAYEEHPRYWDAKDALRRLGKE